MFIDMFRWCMGNCVRKHVGMFTCVEARIYVCINVFF